MDYFYQGYPGMETAARQEAGHGGCGCSTSPGVSPHPFPPSPMMTGSARPSGGFSGVHGPTPSPFPPSPMMPGPSMQGSGFAGPGHPRTGYAEHAQGGANANPALGERGCAGAHQSSSAHPEHPHPGTFQGPSLHHPPLHEAHHYGLYPHGGAAPQAGPESEGYSILGLHLSDGNFWKGALAGAALTLLVTNESVQRAIMMGIAKAYSAAQSGVGEIKEMFEDAQAELKKNNE